MRNNHKARNLARGAGTLLVTVFGIALTWLGTASKVDGVLKNAATFLANLFGTDLGGLLFLSALGVGLGELLRVWAGDPKFYQFAEPLLDSLRRYAFAANYLAQDPEHHHRATLFRYRRFKWWVWPWRKWCNPWGAGRGPFSGWLEPVARSGHATKKTRILFLAPDDADHAEGIAGHIWRCKRELSAIVLPNMNSPPTDAQIAEYAEQSWVDVSLIKRYLSKQSSLPGSMAGFPIFKSGQIWGVVVLDSRRQDAIKSPEENFVAIKITQTLMERTVAVHS